MGTHSSCLVEFSRATGALLFQAQIIAPSWLVALTRRLLPSKPSSVTKSLLCNSESESKQLKLKLILLIHIFIYNYIYIDSYRFYTSIDRSLCIQICHPRVGPVLELKKGNTLRHWGDGGLMGPSYDRWNARQTCCQRITTSINMRAPEIPIKPSDHKSRASINNHWFRLQSSHALC